MSNGNYSRTFHNTFATREKFLDILNETEPNLIFGMREPNEKIYQVPFGIIDRIKQVFTGPQMITRMGEIEIAIMSKYALTEEQKANIAITIEANKPIGTKITTLEYIM